MQSQNPENITIRDVRTMRFDTERDTATDSRNAIVEEVAPDEYIAYINRAVPEWERALDITDPGQRRAKLADLGLTWVVEAFADHLDTDADVDEQAFKQQLHDTLN